MSYVAKTDWKNADIVMPADMNRIEQGIKDNETSINLKADKDLSNIDEQIFKDKLNELGIADKAIKTHIVYSYLADEMETNLKFDNQSEYQQLKDGDYFICYFRHGGPDDITTEFTIEHKRIVDDRGDIIPSQSSYVLNDMTALMQYKDNKFRIFGKHLKSIGSIGNTILLNTTEKKTLVGAINELYKHDGNRIITNKHLIPSLQSIRINKLYAIKINEPLSQINGVQIKKEGTNENYTLPANKVSMVYYNGTNFFVKANASGNAVSADVLAGKTFSNSNGTDLVGTAEIITPSQKTAIVNALIAKNVPTSTNASLSTIIDNIKLIKEALGSINKIDPQTGYDYFTIPTPDYKWVNTGYGPGGGYYTGQGIKFFHKNRLIIVNWDWISSSYGGYTISVSGNVKKIYSNDRDKTFNIEFGGDRVDLYVTTLSGYVTFTYKSTDNWREIPNLRASKGDWI